MKEGRAVASPSASPWEPWESRLPRAKDTRSGPRWLVLLGKGPEVLPAWAPLPTARQPEA